MSLINKLKVFKLNLNLNVIATVSMAALVLSFGIMLGFFGAHEFSAKPQKTNPILQKNLSKSVFQPWADSLQGKMNKAVDIKITTIDGDSSDNKKLIANISLNRTMQSAVSYQWSVPENIRVIDGELSGSLNFSNVSVDQQIQIEVVGLSQAEIEGGMITLRVWGQSGGSRILSSSSYAPQQMRMPASENEQEDEELALSNSVEVGKIKGLHQ